MERRTFLAGTGAALLTAPLAAEAQQAGKIPRVGGIALTPGTRPPTSSMPSKPVPETLGLTIRASLLARADEVIH